MSIGTALAQAREDAGMSLEQVSGATRIRRTIVEAIERDDFTKSGGDFYARAHIRGIARVVGADAEPLLAAFDRDNGGATPGAAAVFETERARPERRGPNWSAAMAAAIALVLVVLVVRQLTGGGGGASTADGSTTSPLPAAGRVTPSASPPPSERPSATATPTRGGQAPPRAVAKAPRGAVTVALSAPRGKTWVRVTGATGAQLFEGLLDKGAQRSFTDPSRVQLVIGNPVAVDLRVNGQDIGSPGDDGKVARVSFTPQDPAVG